MAHQPTNGRAWMDAAAAPGGTLVHGRWIGRGMTFRARVVLAALIGSASFMADHALAGFTIRCAAVKGTNHLFLRDIATYYGMQFLPAGSYARLMSPQTELRFQVDKRESQINNVKVNMTLAPVLWNGELLLSEPDFRLLLDPILRARALPWENPHRIMLDPGHGGRDQGAAGKTLLEKDLNLAIAKLLETALLQRGYTVGLTRNRDRSVSLEQRAAMARRWRADVFISLHGNSAATPSVQGIETFLVTPVGAAPTYGNTVRKTACSGNGFDKRNARLAYELHKALIAGTGAADRGVKHAGFAVLRDAPCPAVLVETGFLSNPAEEQRLGDAGYRQRIVAGLAYGILAYHRSLVDKQ